MNHAKSLATAPQIALHERARGVAGLVRSAIRSSAVTACVLIVASRSRIRCGASARDLETALFMFGRWGLTRAPTPPTTNKQDRKLKADWKGGEPGNQHTHTHTQYN